MRALLFIACGLQNAVTPRGEENENLLESKGETVRPTKLPLITLSLCLLSLFSVLLLATACGSGTTAQPTDTPALAATPTVTDASRPAYGVGGDHANYEGKPVPSADLDAGLRYNSNSRAGGWRHEADGYAGRLARALMKRANKKPRRECRGFLFISRLSL